MSLTAKVVLHPRKREDGTYRVRVRLTRNRVSAFLDAGFTLPLAQFNAKPTAALSRSWVRAGHVEADALNQRLDELLRDAQAAGRDNPTRAAAEVRDALLRATGAPRVVKAPPAPVDGPPTDFVQFAHWYVRQRAKTDKPNTVLFYYNAATALAAWRGTLPLPLADLAKHHLDELHVWLNARPGVYAGTARDRLVKLSTVALHAQRLGLLDARLNPFAGYRLPRVANKQPPIRLTDDHRQQVMALDLNAVPVPLHRPADAYRRSLEIRRDVWALQYYVRGTRISDVLQLRERDVRPDRISFAETKTGKGKSTGRGPVINAILARYAPTGDPVAYVFPVLDHLRPYAALHPSLLGLGLLNTELRARTQWVNNGLRRLAHLAQVPAFTSHSARHMFAEKAYAKTKDIWLLKSLLNHSKIATTEQYMRSLGHDELDAATDSIFEGE